MKRNITIAGALLLLGGFFYYFFYYKKSTTAEKEKTTVLAPVKKGEFKITVTATGELQSKRSVKIHGPSSMRSAGIWQTSIQDIVAEGTVVKEGDYVAQLDQSELANRTRNLQSELEKILTQLEQAEIDTAIDLRAIRDQLVNLQYQKKEKDLLVEQSKYEPQSVIQQSQLDLERTERDFKQLQSAYELKKQQAHAKIQEIVASMKQNQDQLAIMQQVTAGFTVKAPKDGMVIYSRQWGETKGVGSQISAWDPVVAELPDLSDMVSKVYVNEVDISKVRKGQEVKIKVDAFPEKEYSGSVLKVANIGEQLRNYDTKVFEVLVQVNEKDSILRPAMTTSIEINTDTYQDKIYIPLEALQVDSFSYVYALRDGKIVKQEVITGPTNSNLIVIDHGLTEKDQAYLLVPPDAEKLPLVPVDPKIKQEIKRKQEEEAKKRQEEVLARMKSMSQEEPPEDDNDGGGMMIMIGD